MPIPACIDVLRPGMGVLDNHRDDWRSAARLGRLHDLHDVQELEKKKKRNKQMDKWQFHPHDVITNLDAFYDVMQDTNLCLEELSLEDTFKELKEMVFRFIPKKPNGNWTVGSAHNNVSCPRCPYCSERVRSGSGSSSRVRDDRCRKCGQVIDWSDFPKY